MTVCSKIRNGGNPNEVFFFYVLLTLLCLLTWRGRTNAPVAHSYVPIYKSAAWLRRLGSRKRRNSWSMPIHFIHSKGADLATASFLPFFFIIPLCLSRRRASWRRCRRSSWRTSPRRLPTPRHPWYLLPLSSLRKDSPFERSHQFLIINKITTT